MRQRSSSRETRCAHLLCGQAQRRVCATLRHRRSTARFSECLHSQIEICASPPPSLCGHVLHHLAPGAGRQRRVVGDVRHAAADTARIARFGSLLLTRRAFSLQAPRPLHRPASRRGGITTAAASDKPAGFGSVQQSAAVAASPTQCVPLKDASTTALLTWALNRGIACPGLTPGTCGGGLRGMVSTRPIEAGAVVARVPHGSVLEVTSLPSSPPPGLTCRAAYLAAPWWARLALLLLREKALGSASSCAPYIASLPSSPLPTPQHWSDAALARLRDGEFIARIKDSQREIAAQHAALCASPDLPPGSAAARFTASDFGWAVDMVRSRTFSGPYEGSDFIDRVQQTALIAVLTAVYLLTGAGPVDNALSGALAGLGFVFLKDLAIQALPNAPRRYIMVPLLDMCNHQPGVVSDLTYQYFANAFELVIGTGASAAGQEVCISYGQHSAEELLQMYGFVYTQGDNVDDVVTLSAADVDAALQGTLTPQLAAALKAACPLLLPRMGDVLPAAVDAALAAASGGGQGGHRAVLAQLVAGKYPQQQAERDAEDLRALQARASMLRQRSGDAGGDVDETAELLAAQFRVAKAATARHVIAKLMAGKTA